jgi:hypothetical protein
MPKEASPLVAVLPIAELATLEPKSLEPAPANKAFLMASLGLALSITKEPSPEPRAENNAPPPGIKSPANPPRIEPMLIFSHLLTTENNVTELL